MKLMLTSSGLTSKKLRNSFVGLLEKKVTENKVLVVHTAQKPEHMAFVSSVGNELSEAGILHPNISYLNIAKSNTFPRPFDYDIVYVCGGNTYYILDRIRKVGLDKSLKRFVKNGGVYVGVSAGSIIAGRDISIAGWGSEGDPNDIKLRDLRGLGFTDISIFPHYKAKLRREVDSFAKTVDYPVREIKDKEAIIIKGRTIKKVR